MQTALRETLIFVRGAGVLERNEISIRIHAKYSTHLQQKINILEKCPDQTHRLHVFLLFLSAALGLLSSILFHHNQTRHLVHQNHRH